MEWSPLTAVLIALIIPVGTILFAIIDYYIIIPYETRKYKRDFKKTTGRDYDEFIAPYIEAENRHTAKKTKATS